MKRWAAAMLVLLLSGGLLLAGSATGRPFTEGQLRVKVSSAAGGQPVSGAVVGVPEADQAATTDGTGQTRLLRLPILVPSDADQPRAGSLPPRPYALFTVAVTARGYQPLVYEMVNIYPAAKSGCTLLEVKLKPVPADPRQAAAYKEMHAKGHVETVVAGDHKLWLGSLVGYLETTGGARTVWNAANIGRGRETIQRFYALLGQGQAAQAKNLLHQAMDPAYIDQAVKHLLQIEVRKVGEPDLNPDGESIFFPVTLEIKVKPGAPTPWETGISTYFVRLYLIGGEPRIAEITTGP